MLGRIFKQRANYLVLSHMHLYGGWPIWVLQVIGFSGPIEGCRKEGLHLKRSAGVSSSVQSSGGLKNE